MKADKFEDEDKNNCMSLVVLLWLLKDWLSEMH